MKGSKRNIVPTWLAPYSLTLVIQSPAKLFLNDILVLLHGICIGKHEYESLHKSPEKCPILLAIAKAILFIEYWALWTSHRRIIHSVTNCLCVACNCRCVSL